MKARHLAATALATLASAVLTASCVQSPTVAPETDAPALAVEGSPEASTGDEAVGEAQEALKVIKCDNDVGPVECMIRCAEAGIPCRPRLKHPNKSDVADGDLFRCAEALGRRSCSYTFENGDTCVVFSNRTWIPCVYTGGR